MREVYYLLHTDTDGGFNYMREANPFALAEMKASIVPEAFLRGPPAVLFSYAEAWDMQTSFDMAGVTGWEIDGPHRLSEDDFEAMAPEFYVEGDP